MSIVGTSAKKPRREHRRLFSFLPRFQSSNCFAEKDDGVDTEKPRAAHPLLPTTRQGVPTQPSRTPGNDSAETHWTQDPKDVTQKNGTSNPLSRHGHRCHNYPSIRKPECTIDCTCRRVERDAIKGIVRRPYVRSASCMVLPDRDVEGRHVRGGTQWWEESWGRGRGAWLCRLSEERDFGAQEKGQERNNKKRD